MLIDGLGHFTVLLSRGLCAQSALVTELEYYSIFIF